MNSPIAQMYDLMLNGQISIIIRGELNTVNLVVPPVLDEGDSFIWKRVLQEILNHGRLRRMINPNVRYLGLTVSPRFLFGDGVFVGSATTHSIYGMDTAAVELPVGMKSILKHALYYRRPELDSRRHRDPDWFMNSPCNLVRLDTTKRATSIYERKRKIKLREQANKRKAHNDRVLKKLRNKNPFR